MLLTKMLTYKLGQNLWVILFISKIMVSSSLMDFFALNNPICTKKFLHDSSDWAYGAGLSTWLFSQYWASMGTRNFQSHARAFTFAVKWGKLPSGSSGKYSVNSIFSGNFCRTLEKDYSSDGFRVHWVMLLIKQICYSSTSWDTNP